jgi:mycothiol synthase
VTALPAGWITRHPTFDDIPELLKMTHASDIAAVGEPDFTPDDVREALTSPNTDMSVDSWIVLDADGDIVGWAYPDNTTGGAREFIEVYVWPERGIPALRPLLALMLQRVAERAVQFGHDPYTVRAGAVPAETAWIQTLTDAGFVFLKQHARMQMSLRGVSPTAPQPPAGVTVRSIDAADQDELRTLHGVIEEAFRDSDHPADPFPTWLGRVRAEPSRSWDEWFVAEADGRIVGVLQSSDGGGEDDEGWVRNLGVLRAYRKRGVGEALLRRAFAVYAAKGRRWAGLGVDMANPTAAARLYRAVGMHPKYEANIYQRTV